MTMRLRKHRYLAPNPDGPSGTGTAEPPAPATPPASTEPPPSTVTDSAPETQSKGAEPAPAEPKRAPESDNAAKIGSLLDKIGKPEGETIDPKGETDPATAATKPATPATKPPVGETVGPNAPKDPKALDLTPPEGMTERSKTRWTELAERAKQVPILEQRATAAEESLASVRTVIQESGLDPQEFGNVIEIGRLYKSNDAAELKTALEQLDGLRANVATRLGIEAPGVDILAKHPDLAAEVEDMSISRKRAVELAAARDLKARNEEQTQSAADIDAFKRNATSAAADMEKQLAARASTPGHAEKMAFINARLADPVAQKAFVTTYAPHQWAAAMLMMYDAYNPPAPAAAPGQRPPQPLRPGNVSAGVRQSTGKPVTALDAVKSAFDQIGM